MVKSVHFFISSGFWFSSEDQGSKASENTETRKEADEACNTKPSSQPPAQPAAAKGPYGKGPPFSQVCWSQDLCHRRCCGWINLTILDLDKDLGKGNIFPWLALDLNHNFTVDNRNY